MPLVTSARTLEKRVLAKQVVRRYADSKVRFRMTVPATTDYPSQDVITIEGCPRVVTLIVNTYGAGGSPFYRLRKPFSYMNVHFRGDSVLGAQLFFSYSRINTIMDRKLLAIPLMNLSYTGDSTGIQGICFGHTVFRGDTPEEKALHCERYFWTSRFNNEIPIEEESWPDWVEYDGISISVLKAWQERTNKNQAIKFRKSIYGRTLNMAAKSLARYLRED